jgi:hypothetical protein
VQPKTTIMKKILLTTIAVCTLALSYGQKTEFRVSLNSGLFSFHGKSAEKVSFINYNDKTHSGYTNNPFASKNGLCFGLSGNIKRVTIKNFIFGIDAGYEVLRNKIQIDQVFGYTGSSTYQIPANGQTFFNYCFINLHPFFGYRFATKPINFDLTGGLDLGDCLSTKEDGTATASNGVNYKASGDREIIKFDIRPRIQIAAEYKKIGAYIGYSAGLAKFTNGCNERVLRFGLTYQLK